MRLSSAVVWTALFLVGLGLRLPGVLFNGMLDLDEIILVWGAEVRVYGLAEAFKVNYGLFSYALYGLFFALAEQLPRFWWAPYKLGEILFEAGILALLTTLLPARWKWGALALYWLNPWFILHGAWQGFWEGPHTLAGLLAVVVLRRVRDERVAWMLVGVCLMTSAMFKPQGLAYFVIPVFMYLGVQLVRFWHPALGWYTAGLALLVLSSAAWLVAIGGRATQLADNYLGAVRVMPNICNGCVSVWRAVAVALQIRLSQSGPTYDLRLPDWFNSPLHASAALVTLGLLLVVALRVPLVPKQPLAAREPDRRTVLTTPLAWGIAGVQRVFSWALRPPLAASADIPPYLALLTVLALASLIVSQFGTRAHINHTYTALVLLIPLVVGQGRLLVAWLIMVGIQFYAHLATYRLGASAVLPQLPVDMTAAQPLIASMQAALVAQPYPQLLHIQTRVNDTLAGRLPSEPVIAILAFVHFLCVLYTLGYLLRLRSTGSTT